MAVITPNTDLYLLKVPLEIDEVNQLTFANSQAQYNYFYSLPKLAVDDFTYQRKDGTIRFSANFDDIITYNYVMYRNTEYSDKWFYAYITDIQYLNDSVSAVAIKGDSWQTWQFDLNYKPVFVEREHVNDDTVGLHLVPENLETGDYVQNGNPITFTLAGDIRYVINSTYAPYTNMTKYLGVNVYGIPMAGTLIVFDTWTQMVNAIQSYSTKGQLEAIEHVYAVPKNIFDTDDLDYDTGPSGLDDEGYYIFNGNSNSRTLSRSIGRPSSLNGYTPHNGKLLTSPYQNLVVNNNSGSANTLNYEYFANPSASVLELSVLPSIGTSQFIYPKNYKGIVNNYNEGIMGGKWPTLSWSGDSFTNWLTQNAVNIGAGVISDVAKLPLIPYNPVVGTLSLGASIAGQVSEMYKHSIVSQTINGNTNGGDVLTSSKINQFYIYPMSIRAEFAQIIDKYFDMFGYKVTTVKIPNITGRRNWNYVKTEGCYIEADIPQGDLDEIKQLFDRGVTFWHNPATFADYSQNNDII